MQLKHTKLLSKSIYSSRLWAQNIDYVSTRTNMAAAATGQHSKKLAYSAESFDNYYKQLRPLCLKSKGGWILSKLITYPITTFLENQHILIEEEAADVEYTRLL